LSWPTTLEKKRDNGGLAEIIKVLFMGSSQYNV
jgi:hypothetical protein